jgi:hypothetical protein
LKEYHQRIVAEAERFAAEHAHLAYEEFGACASDYLARHQEFDSDLFVGLAIESYKIRMETKRLVKEDQ